MKTLQKYWWAFAGVALLYWWVKIKPANAAASAVKAQAAAAVAAATPQPQAQGVAPQVQSYVDSVTSVLPFFGF